jgi:DNA-binding LytR/AlgR family response regulator
MKTKIKILIAEDEKPLRDHLKNLLQEVWPDAHLCAEAENGRQVLDLFRRHQPQVAFLDIKMPGLSGMQAAKEIVHQCHIVFVTAFDQFAVAAFEQEAVDYLLKPVTVERLQTTVQRLMQRLQNSDVPSGQLAAVTERILSELQATHPEPYLTWLRVQHKDGVRLIPVESVCYFKADEKYTVVVISDGEYLIRTSIKELAAQLHPDRFWQIHRGIVVNVALIDSVSRSVTGRGILKLRGRDELLTVSRSYLHLFRQM